MACLNIIPSDVIAQMVQGPAGPQGDQGIQGPVGAPTALPVEQVFIIGQGNMTTEPAGLSSLTGEVRVASSGTFYMLTIILSVAFSGLGLAGVFPEIGIAFSSLLPGNPITGSIPTNSYGSAIYITTSNVEHAAGFEYNNSSKIARFHTSQNLMAGTHQLRGQIIIPKLA